MRQHRGERCRRTRRLARQQGVHRQIPAQTQRPSAQGANARNQHTHSTGAHNANMRNSMVAIWAHRARSRRAQGAIAQGVIAQGAIAQGMAAQASTHRARRRAPSAESCERFHHRGRSDDKTPPPPPGQRRACVHPPVPLVSKLRSCRRFGADAAGRASLRAHGASSQARCRRVAPIPPAAPPRPPGAAVLHPPRVAGGRRRRALELAPPPAAAHDARPTQTFKPAPPVPAGPRGALPAPRSPPRSALPWLCAPASFLTSLLHRGNSDHRDQSGP